MLHSRTPGYLHPAGQIMASIDASIPGVPGVPAVPALQPVPGLQPLQPVSSGTGTGQFGVNLTPPAAPVAPVAPVAPTAPAYAPGSMSPSMTPAPTTMASLNTFGQMVDLHGNLIRDAAGNPIHATPNAAGQLVDDYGNVITDVNGNPIMYSGGMVHSLHGTTGILIGLGVVALIIAVPAFFGAYNASK